MTAEERRGRKEEVKKIIGMADNDTPTNLDRLYADSRFLSVLEKYFKPSGPTLDAGAGQGIFLSMLHRLGFTETYGVDIDDYLTLARPTREFKIADFNFDRLPWSNNFFRNVAAIEVMEHLENPYHFLREVARVLAPEGIFILTTPNPEHLWNKISFFRKGEFYRFLKGNDHLTLFADPVLKKGALGYFKLRETKYSFGTFPYRLFRFFTYPANKYFGHSVIYVFQKK